MADRRFPPPWTIREVAEAFRVDDANGSAIAYVYFDREDRGANQDRMSYDQARRVASNIAKLPELLGAVEPPSP